MDDFDDDELKCLFKAAVAYAIERHGKGKATSRIEGIVGKINQELTKRGIKEDSSKEPP
jgi:hypothetical protein